MKAARADVATTRGLAEALARDWRKAARFYALFGIRAAMFRSGFSPTIETTPELYEQGWWPCDGAAEIRARVSAVFPILED